MIHQKRAKPFNLKLFENLEWPKPHGNKDTILVSCSVFQDGVGDAVNVLELTEFLHLKLKALGYRVVGLVYLGETGMPYYTARKEDFSRVFDEFYIVDDAFDWSKIQDTLERTTVELAIASGTLLANKATSFRTVHMKEYGIPNPDYNFHNMMDGNMGLPTNKEQRKDPFQESHAYGIKINPNYHAQGEPAERLTAIKDKLFLSLLMEKEKTEPTLEDAKTYLESHTLMPVYAQTPVAAMFYMALMIHVNKGSEKSIDILIPNMAMQKEFFKEELLNMGVHDFILIEKGQEIVIGDRNKAKLRILSHYIKNDDDYESLYNLDAPVVGVSGNTTLAHALNGTSFPLILWFGRMSGQFSRDFVEFCKEGCAAGETPVLYEFNPNFDLNGEKNLCFPTIQSKDLALLNNYYHLRKDEHPGKLESVYKQLAEYLNNPLLLIQWKRLHEIIRKDYNYYDNIESIVKGGIYLSQNQHQHIHYPEVQRALIASDPIQNLIQSKLCTEEWLMNVDTKTLELFAEPLVNRLLTEHRLSVRELGNLRHEDITMIYENLSFNGKLDLETCVAILTPPLLDYLRKGQMIQHGEHDNNQLLKQMHQPPLLEWLKQGLVPALVAIPLVQKKLANQSTSVKALMHAYEDDESFPYYLNDLNRLADKKKASLLFDEYQTKKAHLDNPIFQKVKQTFSIDNVKMLTHDQIFLFCHPIIVNALFLKLLTTDEVSRLSIQWLEETQTRIEAKLFDLFGDDPEYAFDLNNNPELNKNFVKAIAHDLKRTLNPKKEVAMTASFKQTKEKSKKSDDDSETKARQKALESTEWKVSNQTFDEYGFSRLIFELHAKTNLQTLTFENCFMQDEHFKDLVQYLALHPKLNHLVLNENIVSSKPLEAACMALPNIKISFLQQNRSLGAENK